MTDEKDLVEHDEDANKRDPDEVPIRDRKVITQPYDLAVDSLVEQIKGDTIFLRPLSARPNFQRQYVWNNELASRLIESILLNVPIPPCYLSQNEDFELDVIDGQQRLYSIYRFLNNQFALTGLEVLTELNDNRFFEIPAKLQRQLKTHTLRCVLITNESHPEIKFDVFERLNTNTVPLNAQELRNCVHRGALNSLLQELVAEPQWLKILGKKTPDKRLRDEEIILRFFAFYNLGLSSYRTPLKHWLNDAAKQGRHLKAQDIEALRLVWNRSLNNCLIWFDANECFRRDKGKPINKALFDLVMHSASRTDPNTAQRVRSDFRNAYQVLASDPAFQDLIRRSVDHKSRTVQRFVLWQEAVGHLI